MEKVTSNYIKFQADCLISIILMLFYFLSNKVDEEAPVTLEQLRANKSAKSVEELEADIKHMVGISGQLNDSSDNKNDEALIPDTRGPMPQFTNKPANIANNTNSQSQTDDMSAFKKFVSILYRIYFLFHLKECSS